MRKIRSFVYQGPAFELTGNLARFLSEKNTVLNHRLAQGQPDICWAYGNNPRMAFHRIELRPYRDHPNVYQLVITCRWTFRDIPEGDEHFEEDGLVVILPYAKYTLTVLSGFSDAGYEVFAAPMLAEMRQYGAICDSEYEPLWLDRPDRPAGKRR